MSERKPGWYWVKVAQCPDWECARWRLGEWELVGRYSASMSDHVYAVGPRIPTPGEPWQCVPTHSPTIDMVESGACHVWRGQDYERAKACWRAMLAAAPKPEDG